MSFGKQQYARASQAERDLISLGTQQLDQGRALENPNLLHLKDVARLSDADRANVMAGAKAGSAGNDAVTGALAGLRAGAGVNSGAYRLGVDEAAGAAGTVAGGGVNAAAQSLEDQALSTDAGLAEQVVKGQSASLAGLRAGSSAIGAAELARVKNANEVSRQRANTATNLAMLGLKGMNTLAAGGINVDETGNINLADPYKDGFRGWWAENMGINQDALRRNILAGMHTSPDGPDYYRERPGMFGLNIGWGFDPKRFSDDLSMYRRQQQKQ